MGNLCQFLPLPQSLPLARGRSHYLLLSVCAEEVGDVLPSLASFLSILLYVAHFAWYFSFR